MAITDLQTEAHSSRLQKSFRKISQELEPAPFSVAQQQKHGVFIFMFTKHIYIPDLTTTSIITDHHLPGQTAELDFRLDFLFLLNSYNIIIVNSAAIKITSILQIIIPGLRVTARNVWSMLPGCTQFQWHFGSLVFLFWKSKLIF